MHNVSVMYDRSFLDAFDVQLAHLSGLHLQVGARYMPHDLPGDFSLGERWDAFNIRMLPPVKSSTGDALYVVPLSPFSTLNVVVCGVGLT